MDNGINTRCVRTRCVHGSGKNSFNDTTGAVSFPIYQSATFGHPGYGLSSGFDYSRESNPTRQRLEETVSSLENAYDTIAFSTGMAAISACMELFSPGDHIICSDDMYGGTNRIFSAIGSKNGLLFDEMDASNPDNVKAAVRDNTVAIFIETPSNPMMIVSDIRKMSAIAKEHGLLLIVDNTFLSPYFQNPIDLGADIVIHSGSKFLGGHNDTLSGFLCVNSAALSEKLRYIYKTTGGSLAPFDSWLIMRGLKTLALRMERQQENAIKIAAWLGTRGNVEKVYYIGLESHPGYFVNSSQARGYGSMISFRTNTAETAVNVLKRVKLITFAESLGGVETLITYPMVQTHPDVPVETRERLGINDTLLRLSVGVEDADDIIGDLAQALMPN